MSEYTIGIGDCREILKRIPDDYVDAVVTDPPYELGFMGKKWDSSGVAFDPETWRAVLRVLKPGAHLLAFSGTRTYHRMVCAIEDAGFEIRDQLAWMYGSGFPKSVDKKKVPEGIGTALKPAQEPIVLARKPLVGTVAANVLAHGTGGINVDGCRIEGAKPDTTRGAGGQHGTDSEYGAQGRILDDGRGRWPANVLLDETAAAMLDAQSGVLRNGGQNDTSAARARDDDATSLAMTKGKARPGDSGGASRFFYVAKASRSEREAGLQKPAEGRANNHPTVKPIALMRYLCRLITPDGGVVLDPFLGSGTTGIAALAEQFRFIGIELSPEYAAIADARIRGSL